MLNSYSFYSSYCPEYRAVLFSAIGLGYRLPSLEQQVKQDTLVRALIASGMWAKYDVLYMFLNNGSQEFSLINWINPGTYTITITGSPTWASDLGWVGAASSYLDTGWAPGNGPNYIRNSASWYLGMNAPGSGSNRCIFSCESGVANTNRTYFQRNSTATTFSYSLNAAAVTPTLTLTDAIYHGNRSSGTSTLTYRTNIQIATTGTASQPIPTVATMKLLAFFSTAGANTNHMTNGRLKFIGFGGSLTTEEKTGAYNAFNTYISNP